MNTINELALVNQSINEKINELKTESEVIHTQCLQIFNARIAEFIKEFVAPATGIEYNEIRLQISKDNIGIGLADDGDSFWWSHSISAYKSWRSNEREIEIRVNGFTAKLKNERSGFDKEIKKMHIITTLSKSIYDDTELGKMLIGLCDYAESDFAPLAEKEGAIYGLKTIIENNEKEIINIRIDAYMKIGVQYDLKGQLLWLNNKDKAYLNLYEIEKITAKKIHIKSFSSSVDYTYTYQTTIENYRICIKELFEEQVRFAKRKEIETNITDL